MKTAIKFLFTTALVCFISVMAMALEPVVFSVQKNKNTTIGLQLNNVKESTVQITLKDEFGVIIYEDLIPKNKVNHRKYDLRKLPIGSYSLMVAFDDIIKVQKINKQFDNLEIEEEELLTILKPTFREHANYIDLNMMCFFDQKVKVEIRDSEGRTIYTELKDAQGAFQKRFNLSKLKQGSYSIAVEILGAEISKEFTQQINWNPEVAAL